MYLGAASCPVSMNEYPSFLSCDLQRVTSHVSNPLVRPGNGLRLGARQAVAYFTLF